MLNYITYLHYSPGADWVTFVHGAGGSSAIWYKQLREFRKEFNILLVDLRGHGLSKKKEVTKWEKYTFDSIAEDVVKVLDYLKIQSTHFVGISMGTIIIREITEKHPERTLTMIMGGAVMKMNFRGQVLMRLAALCKSIVPYLVLYRFFAFIIMPKKKHRESRLLFINEAKKLYQKEFRRWIAMISGLNPILRFFRINDTGIRTLYIMGAEDHMFLPSIRKLVKDHLSSELFVIADCGHVVNVECPQIFNSKVIAFLKAR